MIGLGTIIVDFPITIVVGLVATIFQPGQHLFFTWPPFSVLLASLRSSFADTYILGSFWTCIAGSATGVALAGRFFVIWKIVAVVVRCIPADLFLSWNNIILASAPSPSGTDLNAWFASANALKGSILSLRAAALTSVTGTSVTVFAVAVRISRIFLPIAIVVESIVAVPRRVGLFLWEFLVTANGFSSVTKTQPIFANSNTLVATVRLFGTTCCTVIAES